MDSFLEAIKSAVSFFFDKTYGILTRVSVGVVIVVTFVVIDNQSGFTFYYAGAKKIEQAEKITSVIKGFDNDPSALAELKRLRMQILTRQSFFDRTISFMRAAINSRNNQTTKANPPSIIESKELFIVDYVTSNWFTFIFYGLLFWGFMQKPFLNLVDISALIVITFVTYYFGYYKTYVFSIVPPFLDERWAVYVTNFLLELVFGSICVGLILYAQSKKEKKV